MFNSLVLDVFVPDCVLCFLCDVFVLFVVLFVFYAYVFAFVAGVCCSV